MLDITKRLEELDCKRLASHVRNIGGGWYEREYPLIPGDLRSLSGFEQNMVKKAIESMPMAQAYYSNFEVGACLLGYDGQLYMGYNKETVSYHGLHAEEIAWAKMPKSENVVLAVTVAMRSADKEASPMPCGECRQKIFEYSAGNIPIVGVKIDLNNKVWEIALTNMDHLLPHAFGRKNLVTASKEDIEFFI